MALSKTFGWLDVHRIAEELADAHPGVSPVALRFTELRAMVEALPDFREEAGHPVNEKILETIQMLWMGEAQDRDDDE
ncbi:MAG: Fe-S cluster assembly protein IscX [Phycisphaeraceae bacterium]|nr:Fe-S cluster assembly protein IscX [Phycisphaeraceae bacterium]